MAGGSDEVQPLLAATIAAKSNNARVRSGMDLVTPNEFA